MLSKGMPLDLRLLQMITRIMDAEISYGPFKKKTHKKQYTKNARERKTLLKTVLVAVTKNLSL